MIPGRPLHSQLVANMVTPICIRNGALDDRPLSSLRATSTTSGGKFWVRPDGNVSRV